MEWDLIEERVMNMLRPIPGYEDAYFITPDGMVVNRNNKVLKPIPSKDGPRVELRHNGQRERILVQDILREVYGGQ